MLNLDDDISLGPVEEEEEKKPLESHPDVENSLANTNTVQVTKLVDFLLDNLLF